MFGIVSYAPHVPYYRLKREEIARASGGTSSPGERAVANYDEDSITMAVDAAMDCLEGFERSKVSVAYFASTTPPYREKQSATVVATAVDLSRQISTADFTDSLRAGTTAMCAGLNALSAGSELALVVASDSRLGTPRSHHEQDFGDGAVALLLGKQDVAVEIESSYAHADEFLDIWRTEEDRFQRSWEERYILDKGYNRNLQEAVSHVLSEAGLTAKDFAKFVFYGPDARSHMTMARSLGFDPETQVQDPLFGSVGNTGCAHAPMMLVAALDKAKPGDRILYASYGDGCEVNTLRVTDKIGQIQKRRGMERHLKQKGLLPSYETYQNFRQLVATEADRAPVAGMYAPLLWRVRSQIVSLHGGRCRQCSTVQYPLGRVCAICQAKDALEEVRLSDAKGEVFTYTKDQMVTCSDPPLVKAVVDFKDGGRIICQMTDRDPNEVAVGMPVDMTFRKMQDAGGVHFYFWKCRPVREGDGSARN